MNYRAIATGALLGLVVALTAGCPDEKTCGPANCQGCCSADGTCTATTSPAACGASGNVCRACGTGESCVSGQCTPGNGPSDAGNTCATQKKCGKSDGTCGQSCTVGCCLPDGSGICLTSGVNNNSCGASGATCTACTGQQTCSAVVGGGSCGGGVTPGTDGGSAAMGAACNTAADCSGLGAGAICKKQTTSGKDTYTNGMCTLPCTGQEAVDPCEALGGLCVGGTEAYGEDDTFCWKSCDTEACRTDGYACYDVGPEGTEIGACWLNPLPELPPEDAGTPAPNGVPGKACAVDSECGPPPDQDPFCIPALNADAGQSGYLGGSCTSGCNVTGAECGDSGICITFGISQTETINLCQMGCTAPFTGQATCRPGYVCRGFYATDGGLDPEGYCKRNCNNLVGGTLADGGQATQGCSAGDTCTAEGHCRDTAGKFY